MTVCALANSRLTINTADKNKDSIMNVIPQQEEKRKLESDRKAQREGIEMAGQVIDVQRAYSRIISP